MKSKASRQGRGKKFPRGILAALAVSTLASCGGGGNGNNKEQEGSQPPPQSALPAINLLAGSVNPHGYQDGPMEQARLGDTSEPYKLTMTPTGDLLISDTLNGTMRRFSPVSQLVSTVASNIDAQEAAVSLDGNIYVSNSREHVVRRIAPDGSVSLVAGQPGVRGSSDGPADKATFWFPSGLALDREGRVYVSQMSDASNTLVRRIDVQTGQVSTVAAIEGRVQAFTVEPDGSLLVAKNRSLEQHMPDGTVLVIGSTDGASVESHDGSATEARFQYIHDLVTDARGHVFVLEGSYHEPPGNDPNYVRGHDHFSIRQVDAQGNVSTVGRWNTSLDNARPGSLAVDPEGTFYVSQRATSAWVSRLARDGTSNVVLGTPVFRPYSLEWQGKDGLGAEAYLPDPTSIAPMPSGQLLASFSEPSRLQTISPQGEVRAFPLAWKKTDIPHQASLRALAVDRAGNVFTNSFSHGEAPYFLGGGEPSRDNRPFIIRIAPGGQQEHWLDLSPWISPFASGGRTRYFRAPIGGIAIDEAGMLYVSGVNGVLLKVSPDKQVTLLAGQPGVLGHADGTAEQARFGVLGNLTFDCDGNLLALDGLRDDLTGIGPTIRKITPQGMVSTVAGNAGQPFGLQDGAAADARFSFGNAADWFIFGGLDFFGKVGEDVGGDGGARIASDQACNVYTTDPFNSVVRRLSPTGQVATIVGQPGYRGFLSAPLPGIVHTPQGIAVQGNRLLFTMKDVVAFINLP